jgi:hypothetical protein
MPRGTLEMAASPAPICSTLRRVVEPARGEALSPPVSFVQSLSPWLSAGPLRVVLSMGQLHQTPRSQ